MEVYILVKSIDCLHRGTRSAGGLQTFEADNLDQAKATEEYTDRQIADSAAKRWCKRCFPEVWQQQIEAAAAIPDEAAQVIARNAAEDLPYG